MEPVFGIQQCLFGSLARSLALSLYLPLRNNCINCLFIRNLCSVHCWVYIVFFVSLHSSYFVAVVVVVRSIWLFVSAQLSLPPVAGFHVIIFEWMACECFFSSSFFALAHVAYDVCRMSYVQQVQDLKFQIPILIRETRWTFVVVVGAILSKIQFHCEMWVVMMIWCTYAIRRQLFSC